VSEPELLALIRDARPHLLRAGPDTEAWLSRVEDRREDVHELVDRLLVADPAAAAEVCATLWMFWWQRGHMSEGRAFLERASALEGVDKAPLLKGLGTIAFRQGDLETAERAFHERLRLVEEGGHRRDLVDACTDMARVALRRGDFAEVRRHAERGFEVAEGLEDVPAVRLPLHMRAAAARMEGRLHEARSLYLASIELNERLGSELNIAGENHNLVHVALHAGDRGEAERRFRASSAWIFANENAYLRPYAFLDAGILALHDGDRERAGRLVACAQRIFDETDSIPDPDDHVELSNAVARLREELSDRFAAVWDEGRGLSLEDAQILARDVAADPPGSTS
jgi:tetratricopeptide (TPR) repeat protein